MLNLIFRRRRAFTRFTQQLQRGMRGRLSQAAIWLLVLSTLHVMAMVQFEGLTPANALWLTITTLTTVGYGDLSAVTPLGRLSTTLLLYVAGITLLAQLASDYIDYRLKRKEFMIKGLWKWNMEGHVLIISSPKSGSALYFKRLVDQLRANQAFADTPVQLLTDAFPDGLPASLREMGVVHYHADPSEPNALVDTTPQHAKAIILLAADENSRTSDSITLDILMQLDELCGHGMPYTVAECVEESNRSRLEKAGANTTIRPVRAYPEILVRSIVAPGAEKILENLFTHHDDHTLRYDVQLTGAVWADTVCKLMNEGLGTLMAYVTETGHVECHPAADHRFDAQALIVMVREENVPSAEQLYAALG